MGAEALLHYLWEHRLMRQSDMVTVDGSRIVILDPGLHNNDAGPDFFNAKIIIDDQTWVGNVEIHVNASDWYRHGHQFDPAYDNVILHVVGHSDKRVLDRNEKVIPQMILPYSEDYHKRYAEMVNNGSRLPCAADLADIPSLYISDWITSLGFERLYDKVERVLKALNRLDGDWQATAYVTLARALGFGTNSDAFERLAYACPLRPLLKHRNDVSLLEAALFGQAGLLNTVVDDPADKEYVERLRKDHAFFCNKYGLNPEQTSTWKMARMRPPNFPQRRIALLVSMIASGFDFGRRFVTVTDEKSARALFDASLQGYWVNHYDFGKQSAHSPRALSNDSVSVLIINVVAPLLYAYGLEYASDERTDYAVALLHSLKPESNFIVNIFTDAGIPCDDAFTSQALIQLRRAYCEPRKCLFCRVGHRILANKVRKE